MTLHLGFDDLLAYTDWDRENWHAFFRQNGDAALAVSAGPHGDGRMTTIGDVVKHIFGAEIRYVDRLSDRPLTDWAAMPSDNTEALFELGAKSRASLRHLL